MIPLFKVHMNESATNDVSKVLSSGYITQGKKVEEFEEKLKEYFDTPNIVTLNSGTSGLSLALKLLEPSNIEEKWPGLSQEDEVLTTPLTCTATNWPILASSMKLKIKWVDVDNNTCNINLDDLRSKLTYRTKVIMFVHWGGTPVNLDIVSSICDEAEEKFGFRPKVIEDCAHAFGAEFKNKKLGATGHDHFCMYSLQAIKHLTTVDGGLLITPKNYYERAKLLRWYGIDRDRRNYKGKDFRMEHNVSEWGFKFHMNDVCATIGLSNLEGTIQNINTHRQNAYYYLEKLTDLEHVSLLKENNLCNSSYWIYTIKVSDKESFISYMKDKGIMTSQVHNRNDFHSCVKEFERDDMYVLDWLEEQIVSIPVGWWVTKDNLNYIVNSIKDWNTYLCNKDFPTIRPIQYSDYFKGYLGVAQQLSKIKLELSYTEFRDRLKKISSNDGNVKTLILVVVMRGKVVGCGTLLTIYPKLHAPDKLCYIDDVVVDKNMRGNGLGTKLIEKLVENAKETKCYKVLLNCVEDNIKFYEKCCFIQKGIEMSIYFK